MAGSDDFYNFHYFLLPGCFDYSSQMAGSADLQAVQGDKMADFNTTSGKPQLFSFLFYDPSGEAFSFVTLSNVRHNIFHKQFNITKSLPFFVFKVQCKSYWAKF